MASSLGMRLYIDTPWQLDCGNLTKITIFLRSNTVATIQGWPLIKGIVYYLSLTCPLHALENVKLGLNSHDQQSVLSCLSSQKNDRGNSFTSLYTCYKIGVMFILFSPSPEVWLLFKGATKQGWCLIMETNLLLHVVLVLQLHDSVLDKLFIQLSSATCIPYSSLTNKLMK